MAYFSNGSEGMLHHLECAECILADKFCPIASVQMSYNYDACNNKTATAILNNLIKQTESGDYVGCQMRPLLMELAVELRTKTQESEN